MNRLYDDDSDPPGRGYTRDPDRSASGRTADREISLGAPAILGLFFALALLCAGFFGFGYTMGRKSGQATVQPIGASSDTSMPSSLSADKPAAGSPASQPAAQPSSVDSTPPAPLQTATVPIASPSASTYAPTPPGPTTTAADKPAPPSTQPPTGNQQPAIAPTGTFMVQVAAVSSQDVANILLASLQKKGYAVVVRHEQQDNLLHVQIGPFATRQEAEAMQQHVLADGFNAIVK